MLDLLGCVADSHVLRTPCKYLVGSDQSQKAVELSEACMRHASCLQCCRQAEVEWPTTTIATGSDEYSC